MNEGQIAKCISQDFPMIRTTEDDKSRVGQPPKTHPTVGNYYQICEVLGDFLSFDMFNEDSICWWHKSRFRLATLDELESFGLLNIVNAQGDE